VQRTPARPAGQHLVPGRDQLGTVLGDDQVHPRARFQHWVALEGDGCRHRHHGAVRPGGKHGRVGVHGQHSRERRGEGLGVAVLSPVGLLPDGVELLVEI
jgi:hypothetical protein